MSVDQHELARFLDQYLNVREIEDYPNALNGLQVENAGTVNRIVVAVDACEATIDRAVERGADFMLVHHGLFWGGLQAITGRHGRRIRKLVAHGIALYAVHLPLDLHPEVGNNIILARLLGVRPSGWFGEDRGRPIGVAGQLDVPREELVRRIKRELGVEPLLIAAGPTLVNRVGIISGGGGNMIGQARDAGLDTYITGEGAHHTYFDAEEWRMNVVYAGHYATETVGVRALGEYIAQRFGLPWDFVDHPTGL